MTGQSRRWARLAAAVAVGVAVSMLGWGAAVASAGSTHQATGHGRLHGRSLFGSWRVTATATAPVPTTAHVLITFMPGGGLVETRLLAKPPIPGIVDFPTVETPGHGAWRRTGPSTYEVEYVYFIQAADSADLLATETVHWQATISPDGQTIAGPASSEVHLADGTLAASWTFTGSGTRITP